MVRKGRGGEGDGERGKGMVRGGKGGGVGRGGWGRKGDIGVLERIFELFGRQGVGGGGRETDIRLEKLHVYM